MLDEKIDANVFVNFLESLLIAWQPHGDSRKLQEVTPSSYQTGPQHIFMHKYVSQI